MPVEPFRPGRDRGLPSSLYHEMAETEAQGIIEVKKLSNESASAADHAQINITSTRVWASLADVRHKPKGRPKYSTCNVYIYL